LGGCRLRWLGRSCKTERAEHGAREIVEDLETHYRHTLMIDADA